MKCKVCEEEKSNEHFAPHTINSRQICKECQKIRMARYRGDSNLPKRLFYNLRQRGRERGIEEIKLWRIDHVRELIQKWDPPPAVKHGILNGMKLRLRIVKVDKLKPFLPDNSTLDIF